MKKSVFILKLHRHIIYMLSMLIFCSGQSIMAADIDKFNSVDIKESPLLGQDMKTLETKIGKAKFVKGLSRSYEKIISRDDLGGRVCQDHS